ncbi:MAG: BREX system Lon protease-like protein BrxL [Pirellula sp.]
MEPPSDEDLEWAVRLALECRRRIKEEQKRIGSAEFRNTQFRATSSVKMVLRSLLSLRTPEQRPYWPCFPAPRTRLDD